MRILLVDDTLDTLQLYCLVLELQDFTVQIAANGQEALRAVQEEPHGFDAVILDVEMPQMNGWDTLRAIRALPQGQKIYIIMFTAYGTTKENRHRAQELGADSVFEKPVLPQVLVDAIRHGVEQKRLMSH